MKKYWIVFTLIVFFCFFGLVVLIYTDFFKPSTLVLDTGQMKEESAGLPDTSLNFQIDAIYPSNELNNHTDTISWADVYVCTSFTKEDSLSGHTKFILLDINTKPGLGDIKYLDDYSPVLKKEIFKKCKVKIPPGIINDIDGYKYRMADVKLIYSVIDY